MTIGRDSSPCFTILLASLISRSSSSRRCYECESRHLRGCSCRLLGLRRLDIRIFFPTSGKQNSVNARMVEQTALSGDLCSYHVQDTAPFRLWEGAHMLQVFEKFCFLTASGFSPTFTMSPVSNHILRCIGFAHRSSQGTIRVRPKLFFIPQTSRRQ